MWSSACTLVWPVPYTFTASIAWAAAVTVAPDRSRSRLHGLTIRVRRFMVVRLEDDLVLHPETDARAERSPHQTGCRPAWCEREWIDPEVTVSYRCP